MILKTILSLFKNPMIIIGVLILVALTVLTFKVKNLRNDNEALNQQVKVLQADTTARALKQIECEQEVIYYSGQLDQIKMYTDSVEAIAIKNNPGLATRFPSIEALKKKRK